MGLADRDYMRKPARGPQRSFRRNTNGRLSLAKLKFALWLLWQRMRRMFRG